MAQKRYLCAVCRTRLPELPSRHISFATHGKIALVVGMTALCAMLFMGNEAAAKALLLYLPIWLISDWFQWLSLRSALKCKVCHFDPMLYRSNWKAARKQVEIRMQEHSTLLQERIRTEIERLSAQKITLKQSAPVAAPLQGAAGEKASASVTEPTAQRAKEETEAPKTAPAKATQEA